MANEEHLKILKQGVEAWNEWRAANVSIQPELSGVDLRGIELSRAKFNGANLRGAMLKGVILDGAFLDGADLREAYLGGTQLRRADLSKANLASAEFPYANLSEAKLVRAVLFEATLSKANLVKADLRGASLIKTELDGADLSAVTIRDTTFGEVDLSTVKGIETIRHEGPSVIGIETIYLSKGKIPAHFLRGAGVPDNFIDYMSSLVGAAFEFYSCFVSYSGKDQEFADRLFADLQREGVRCWFAPHHVQAGKKLHEQIDVAIRLHEKLLLILSPESINSEWVKTEIAKARKREIGDKRVLFPIRLNISYEQLQEWECFDADRGKDSAREIREYYIPDFTNWKHHDQYQEEFKKLVRDLKK
jgi:hypothetical protein